MSDKEYHVVDVDLTEAEELKPDVHLEVAGVKLDLPNLNNAELPIELVQAILLVKSKPALSDYTVFSKKIYLFVSSHALYSMGLGKRKIS